MPSRTKRQAPSAPLDPSRNILARTEELGLRAVCYTSMLTEPYADGSTYWIPRDCIGKDGLSMIVYRKADSEYSIDGWETWHDGMFGGRSSTYAAALGWIERAKDIRAGRASHF